MSNPISRRRFLAGLGLTAAGAVLAACQGTPVPTPTTAPAAQSTATRPAAGTTPAAGSTPAAGTTPTAGSTPAAGTTPTAGASTGGQTGTGAYTMNTNVTGAITFWHFWGSPLRRNAIRRIVNSFQAQYPGVKVTETFVPFGEIWTKNNAAGAAGSGMPDVLVEDRPQLRDRAQKNIDISLGDLAKRDNVTGAPFWKFAWEEASVNGQPYGLPYETDIRVLFYNKALLKDAGFNPDQPPKDWNELEAMADKIDIKDASGKLERVGFYPTFGNMGLDQWTWNNGGEWMDNNGNFTINAKPNVDTLEWMKKWVVDRYGKANWDALAGTFGPQGPTDGFMAQKVAMKVDIAGYTSFLNQTNPNFTAKSSNERLGWGVAPIPPAPGKSRASLSGGFALAIPRGVKNIDQAWEFIKYAVFVGQSSWARDTYSIPTIERLARENPELLGDPNWQFFIEAMSYGRPAAFNQWYPGWSEVLGPAQDAVYQGRASAQQALDEAQQKAQAEVTKNRR